LEKKGAREDRERDCRRKESPGERARPFGFGIFRARSSPQTAHYRNDCISSWSCWGARILPFRERNRSGEKAMALRYHSFLPQTPKAGLSLSQTLTCVLPQDVFSRLHLPENPVTFAQTCAAWTLPSSLATAAVWNHLLFSKDGSKIVTIFQEEAWEARDVRFFVF